ncbi:MAG: translocated intimin receptor Tir [Acidobacteria bacterium]|nr:translocated intimin receptor Tir [Acidobacteriota bacterium]
MELKPTLLNAILTDLHFWIPATVLVIGFAILIAVQ